MLTCELSAQRLSATEDLLKMPTKTPNALCVGTTAGQGTPFSQY